MATVGHRISVGQKTGSFNHGIPQSEVTPSNEYTAEHTLLTAIVQRAYLDLSIKVDYDTQHVRTARTWILDPSRAPWSYLWMCEQLNLSDRVMEAIRKAALETYD